MANPAAWATMGIGASAGGGLLGAIGASQSGKATASMLSYQAGVADLNRRIALQNRDYAVGAGESQALESGLKSRFQMGRIIASQAAGNVDVSSGSPKAVQQSQQSIAELDQANIRNNAARVAYGFESQAATADAQSKLYNMAASNTRKAIPLNVASSLISGAGSVSSKWLQGYGSGAFGGNQKIGGNDNLIYGPGY